MLFLNKIKENEEKLSKLEKERNIFLDVNSNKANNNALRLFIISILTKKFDDDNMRVLSDLFPNVKFDLVKFLSARIEGLEMQNYSLITKNETLSNLTKNTIDELIEYYEVINDIRNVLNQVYEAQAITREFLIIRETLNSRSEYVTKQKDSYLYEKELLEKDTIKEKNIEVLLCKDKIMESRLNSNTINNQTLNTVNSKGSLAVGQTDKNKLFEIIDEKIEIYDNLKNNLAYYEEYIQNREFEFQDENMDENKLSSLRFKESLLNDNYMLKSKNIRLVNFIKNILKKKEIEFSEKTVDELTDIVSCDRDIVFTEDLFHMLKSQALLMENMIISEN